MIDILEASSSYSGNFPRLHFTQRQKQREGRSSECKEEFKSDFPSPSV